jgi:AcrR family transcriptional regulator
MKPTDKAMVDRTSPPSKDDFSDDEGAAEWDMAPASTTNMKTTKWDLRKIRTRRLILRAGRELFAREGFDAPRVEDIARAAGVSRAAFYLHFKSIYEVVQAVFVREIRWQLRRYRSLDREILKSERRIRGWLERFTASFSAERQYVLIIFRAYAMDPANVLRVFEEHNLLIQRLARRVPELGMITASGELDPIRAIQLGGFLRRIETASLYSAYEVYPGGFSLVLDLLSKDLAEFVRSAPADRG